MRKGQHSRYISTLIKVIIAPRVFPGALEVPGLRKLMKMFAKIN